MPFTAKPSITTEYQCSEPTLVPACPHMSIDVYSIGGHTWAEKRWRGQNESHGDTSWPPPNQIGRNMFRNIAK